jgi:membrane-associated PAP2 superfamily phosphatase
MILLDGMLVMIVILVVVTVMLFLDILAIFMTVMAVVFHSVSYLLWRLFVALLLAMFLEIKAVLIWPSARGSVMVKALCYKPEGRRFDTRRDNF